jgi:FAD synthetase
LGDYLVVAVAQDHIVRHLKGHEPQLSIADRFEHLQNEDGVDEVVIGDADLSVYEVVKQHKPDVVALGYDQMLLKEDLEKNRDKFNWPLELRVVSGYEPNIYHSSLLND